MSSRRIVRFTRPLNNLRLRSAFGSGVRAFASQSRRRFYSSGFGAFGKAAMLAAGLGLTFAVMEEKQQPQQSKVGDYDAVRKAIAAMLDDESHDDGSRGPLLVRLAWHAAGTYDKASNTGGSNGATMRFPPESEWGANAGLVKARKWLEPIKQQFPWISYADLWTLAGTVAIEEMGGPAITWRPGRSDAADSKSCPPDGRLPAANKGASHIRDVFGRMGFSDQEMVALLGAHSLGRCHRDRSGYEGPWTRSPVTFSNEYFRLMLEEQWAPRKWDGPHQYANPAGDLMMLPADLALIVDPAFKKYVELYAKDRATFDKDFAAAWQKLMELGVPSLQK